LRQSASGISLFCRFLESKEIDPGNESLRVCAVLLDLQAGEEELAREQLAGLTSSSARDLRRQAMIAAMGRNTANRHGTHRSDLARELNELRIMSIINLPLS
jgi:hypothetical protein